MEKESPRQRLVEANSTGGQGSGRAVEPGGAGGCGQVMDMSIFVYSIENLVTTPL